MSNVFFVCLCRVSNLRCNIFSVLNDALLLSFSFKTLRKHLYPNKGRTKQSCKPHCKSSTNKRFLPGSVKAPPVHGVDLVKTQPIYCTLETGSGHATPAAPRPPLTPPPHHLCESHRMHTHLHTSSCTKTKTTYHTCFYSFTPQCPTNH